MKLDYKTEIDSSQNRFCSRLILTENCSALEAYFSAQHRASSP
jgi:hypothetical protein